VGCPPDTATCFSFDAASLFLAVQRSNLFGDAHAAAGWAAANALMFHFAPILSGGFTSEFSVTRVMRACQANVYLVRGASWHLED